MSEEVDATDESRSGIDMERESQELKASEKLRELVKQQRS